MGNPLKERAAAIAKELAKHIFDIFLSFYIFFGINNIAKNILYLSRNGRLQYAQELAKYIGVDIYGACGSLRYNN